MGSGNLCARPESGSMQCLSPESASRRPAGSPVFDHALGGSGDCVACHAVMSATKTDWTGGSFTHTSAITSCASCHTGDRPTGPVGPVPPFNHANGRDGRLHELSRDEERHEDRLDGRRLQPRAQAGDLRRLSPAARNRQRPSASRAPSTDGKTYQNDYLHSLVAGDCVGCHIVRSATQTDWTGGNYSHSPVPASCTTCHTITKPAAGQSAFDHSAAGTRRLQELPRFPGQRWTGASAVPSIVILTPPTGRNWGNITAPHPVIDSAKTGLTCATCHGTNTSAMIIGYDHAFPVTGSKCVYCHYTGQTETSSKVKTRSHESTSNTKDCTSSGCHRPSLPTWNASTKKFSGGAWGEP